MDVEILKYGKQPDRSNLIQYLNAQSVDTLTNVVKECLWNTSQSNVEPLLLIRAIILGSPVTAGDICVQRRLAIMRLIVEWLSSETGITTPIQSKAAVDLVNMLLPEMETLSEMMLYELGLDISRYMQDKRSVHAKLFDILSKCYNVLLAADQLEKAKEIIQRIQSVNWHPQSSVSIVSAINDMDITANDLEPVIVRCMKQLDVLETEEVPPFVYQLLLLSRKGHKGYILGQICKYFDEKLFARDTTGPTPASNLRVEGTVMLHISFAIKQDQELGNELVKYARKNKGALLEVFTVACLLSAARIHRLEDKILDLIKSQMFSSSKNTEKLKKCPWISEFLSVDFDRIRDTLINVAQKSAQGWDQVIHSLLQLALVLVDTTAGQGNLKKATTRPRLSKALAGPKDEVSELGIELLFTLFKLHDIVRAEILEQITSRIISQSSSGMLFIDVLARIITECTEEIDSHLNQIKDMMDYLSLLRFDVAERLLNAVYPIVNMDGQFRDRVMLILRKSMFTKDLESRLVSVHGFLDLLRNQLAELEQRNEPAISNASMTEGTLFEILGLLRKCFSQQYEIRAAAYHGLGFLAQNHSRLADHVFEILYTQFSRSFEGNTAISAPLKLDRCVESALSGGYPTAAEPIHILLANLFSVVRRLSSEKIDDQVIGETLRQCQSDTSSLILRLTKFDYEDYELDKDTGFDMATYVGRRNNHYAGLLIGSLEMAIEHEFMSRGSSIESFQTVLNLFKKRKDLYALLKEKSTNEKGKCRKAILPQYDTTLLGFDCISKLAQVMFMQGDLQTPARSLRSDIDLVQYVVANTKASLDRALEIGPVTDNNQLFDSCVQLAKVYSHILRTEDSDSTLINLEPKKGNSVICLIIDATRAILETVDHVWPHRLTELGFKLFDTTGMAQVPENKNEILINAFVYFKDILSRYLTDRTPLYKEASNMIQVVLFLVDRLDRDGDLYLEHILEWAQDFARDRPIEDTTVVKDMIALLIKLCAEMKRFEIVIQLAQDVHTLHGDLEATLDSQEVDLVAHYMMVNDKTLDVITAQLLAYLQQELDDLAWCIGQYKASVPKETDMNATGFHNETCHRLLSCLKVASELIKAVLIGTVAEGLIRVLEKLYKTLLILAKLYLSLAKGIEIPAAFVTVVELVGTDVTDKMYKFLTIHGQRQEETGRSRAKSGKKAEINIKEKAKIVRESRMIPNLIFAVEQFEQHLIQLSRKSKKDLMQYMKRSTARDFKIKLDTIKDLEEEESMKRPRHDVLRPEANVQDLDESEQDEAGAETYADDDQGGQKRIRLE